jgi:superfamily II DNA/RNA helicase
MAVVTLRSAQNDAFRVNTEVATISTLVRNIVEDLGADEPIPLPNIPTDVLRTVLAYCSSPETFQVCNDSSDSSRKDDLCNLVAAADYLCISPLLARASCDLALQLARMPDPHALTAPAIRANLRALVSNFVCRDFFSVMDPRIGRGLISPRRPKYFDKFTETQYLAILAMMIGFDTIVAANRGSGKTLSLVAGLLSRIDLERKPGPFACQALVLSPSPQLAGKVQQLCTAIGEYTQVTTCACTVGRATKADAAELATGRDVVVGTPSSIKDLVRKGQLRLDECRFLVLHEAAELLEAGMGFRVYDIFKALPTQHVQVALSVTTIPPEPDNIVDQTLDKVPFLRDPIRITEKESHFECLRHYYIHSENPNAKLMEILNLYEQTIINQAIIYCNSKWAVRYVSNALTRQDFSVYELYEEIDAKEQERRLHGFRTGTNNLLVCTDCSLRGADVPQVSHAISFDLPFRREDYVLRVGRAGSRRAESNPGFGRCGVAVNFVTPDTAHVLADLNVFYALQMKALPAGAGALPAGAGRDLAAGPI